MTRNPLVVHIQVCVDHHARPGLDRRHHRNLLQRHAALQSEFIADHGLVREISPIELAGQFSTFYVVLFRCGFLVAYMIGIGLPSSKANIDYSQNNYWRFMLAFPIFVALAQTIMLFTVYTHETPKFLYAHRKRDECEDLLAKIYKDESKIQRVLSKLKALQMDTTGGRSAEVSIRELFGRTYLKAMIVIFGNSTLCYPCSTSLLPAVVRRQRVHDVLEHDIQEQPCHGDHSAGGHNSHGRDHGRRHLLIFAGRRRYAISRATC